MVIPVLLVEGMNESVLNTQVEEARVSATAESAEGLFPPPGERDGPSTDSVKGSVKMGTTKHISKE